MAPTIHQCHPTGDLNDHSEADVVLSFETAHWVVADAFEVQLQQARQDRNSYRSHPRQMPSFESTICVLCQNAPPGVSEDPSSAGTTGSLADRDVIPIQYSTISQYQSSRLRAPLELSRGQRAPVPILDLRLSPVVSLSNQKHQMAVQLWKTPRAAAAVSRRATSDGSQPLQR
ncbi:uncharacterized protein CLUP02_13169 [Colletotrichum lupini]|uniref:Uncharacterized protein n=1 Tax=Colletotrichum lupini TaxID=145971 RepID=A0A9Q8WLH0_9PEZI|nr:uncharacterized protein CLUP02_13169 [Colletotrichum lupini]UQC87651.1 hypothetical protein CLUP02_13169 [Colletotrichum lupini]